MLAKHALFFCALFLAACSGAGDDEDTSAAEDAALAAAHRHAFDVGMNEWLFELPDFGAFHAAAAPPVAPRLCHVYTYWDIAHRDPLDGDATHRKAGLLDWFAKVKPACDEVLVTFQGEQGKGSRETPPSVAAFERAFLDFRAMLPDWNGKLSFTAWNEPNNGAPDGDGLGAILPPELAADYYLALRKHCAPRDGCKVAAGDFATNGGLADDLARNCASDVDLRDTPERCFAPSQHAHGAGPTYLDRYKTRIVREAAKNGLPAGFRPEVWAYHPWHDVNAYVESRRACGSYDTCVTRRFLESLGASWAGAKIWDDEIGVGLQGKSPIDPGTQACGAAFLVQLTDLSPRIERVYYMMFSGGNGPLFDAGRMRSAGKILAHQSRTAPNRACAPTGL